MRSRAGDSRARARTRNGVGVLFFFSSVSVVFLPGRRRSSPPPGPIACREERERRGRRLCLMETRAHFDAEIPPSSIIELTLEKKKKKKRKAGRRFFRARRRETLLASFVRVPHHCCRGSWGRKESGARAASSPTPRLGCGFVLVIIGALAVGPLPYACVAALHR